MSQEIERKFLVTGDYRPFVKKTIRIVQGYLSLIPERTVRVRIKSDTGILTIKGIANKSGASRFEWETKISLQDAENLIELCEPGIIKKTRNLVKVGKHIYEVDEFYDENEGLTIAEIELKSENELFEKPDWLGEEVTGDIKYFNSMLIKNPYKNWIK